VESEGVYVLDRDGQVLDTGGAPGMGVSWTEEDGLRTGEITEGRAPAAAGEVVLDADTVEKTGFEVGDSITLLTTGPRIDAELVGVFSYGENGGLAGASMAAFDTATAQELLLAPGAFTAVAVAAESGVSHDDLAETIAVEVGSGYDVKTKSEQAADLATALEDGLSFINTFLLAFAGVALFVGSFLILNTFSMLVAQRTRELALLRALGAKRRQVTASVLLEALLLGVLGSTTGLGVGLGLAHGLKALFGRLGLTLDSGLVFTLDTVLWSYAVGVLVTVVAAYLPARKASKVPPVAAMRDEAPGAARSLTVRTVTGSALAAVGAVALLLGTRAEEGAPGLVGLGAVALVAGAIALSPVLARPFIRLVGLALPRLAGRTGHLARENAVRNPRRTAATSSALMIGLALVTGFSIVGASANAAVDDLVEDSIAADYVVSTTVGQPFTPEVAERLREVDGVETVTQSRFGTARIDGEDAFFVAFDPATIGDALHVDVVSGDMTELASDGLYVEEPVADENGWVVGQEVEFLLPNGEQRDLRVAGTYEPNEGMGSYVVSMDTFDGTGGAALDRYVYLTVADGAAGAAREAIEEVVAAYPVVDLKDREEFKDEQRGQVDQLLMIINALLVLSVLIAVLGVVNTLVLSVIERTRELGLLRAIGMSRRQVRRMVRLESVVISVYGAALGLGLGTLLGVSLVGALESQGIARVVLPGGQLVGFLLVGALIGVVAAALPARRAGRLKVLEAIATE
jgi:putative ABC transport system permease protein